MKRYTQTVFVIAVAAAVAVALFFLIFSQTRSKAPVSEPVRYRSFAATSDSVDDQSVGAEQHLVSAIELNPDETLLDIYAFNLDLDDEDEQILVVRAADNPLIRIVVADYDARSKRWLRAWDGGTLASKVKTFQAAVYDLVGDHTINIVCTGMDEDNRQTMTVFRRADAGSDGDAFQTVFQTAADAVMVETTERPESYKLGQTDAESWNIAVWTPDPESSNFLDQIKETWAWSFLDRAYVQLGQEKIPGASIAQKMAQAILDGKAETFEAWLDGIWYKESTDPLSKDAQFLTFQPKDATLMFSGQSVVEVFDWETSNPTRFGLYIAARNQSVRNLRRLMNVELAAADTVVVHIFQDWRIKADVSGRWDGRYRRLSPDTAKAFKRQPSSASTVVSELKGSYRSDAGDILSLDGASYRLQSGESVEVGSYAVFQLDGLTLLDLRAVTVGDQPSSKRSTYELSRSTKTLDDGSTTDMLSLTPARVAIDGAVTTESAAVVFTLSD